MNQSWPLPRKPFLFNWSVSPERNPPLSSLAEHKVSWQHFGREENVTGVTLFSLQTCIGSFLIMACLSKTPDCPQIQILSGSTALGSEPSVFCLGPVGSGLSSFHLPSAYSPVFHSASYPHLLKYLVYLMLEHSQNLAVQTACFLLILPPTSLNFILILMLCQASYHLFILFWVFKCSYLFTNVISSFILFVLWGLTHFYIFTVFCWVSGTIFNPKYIFHYFQLIVYQKQTSLHKTFKTSLLMPTS